MNDFGTNMKTEHKELIASLNAFADECHATSRSKLFWDDRDKLGLTNAGKVQVDLACIALAISELGEACEAIRKPRRDDHCPEFSNLEVELADCIIRLIDFASCRGLRVPAAMVAKANHNKSRPAKHGKLA